MPDLRFVDVSKSFDGITALKDIDLHVAEGEYTVILGSTGAGKSTLLRIAAGILRPDKGEVYIGNQEVSEVPPEERGVGYFPQGYALFPHMTVLGNVQFGLLMKGVAASQAQEKALEILRLVGLAERSGSLPSELSGGMQQRVALARAIAPGTGLLLLDEPLGALDAILKIELRYEVKKLAQRLNSTVIHVTHDQEVALSLADKMAIMRRGVIEQVGSPGDLYTSPDSVYVANFLGEMNFMGAVTTRIDEKGTHFDFMGMKLVIERQVGREGNQVVLATRPENVALVATDAKRENVMPATVQSTTFSSAVHRIRVLLPNDQAIAVRVPQTEMRRPPSPGANVMVHLDQSKLLVYPYPREGLLRALQYE